jgi:hypothetical protein
MELFQEKSANCFLVEKDTKLDQKKLIDGLVDLKMLHLIKSREAVTDRRQQFMDYSLISVSILEVDLEEILI